MPSIAQMLQCERSPCSPRFGRRPGPALMRILNFGAQAQVQRVAVGCLQILDEAHPLALAQSPHVRDAEERAAVLGRRR